MRTLVPMKRMDQLMLLSWTVVYIVCIVKISEKTFLASIDHVVLISKLFWLIEFSYFRLSLIADLIFECPCHVFFWKNKSTTNDAVQFLLFQSWAVFYLFWMFPVQSTHSSRKRGRVVLYRFLHALSLVFFWSVLASLVIGVQFN